MAPPRSSARQRSAWKPFDPEEFARQYRIPIFGIDFDRLMGCFVRLRRDDGGPDRVGIGVREDLLDDRDLVREYHATLLHELGHWATTVGVLLPVAGFQETRAQLFSARYLSSKSEEGADRWAMRQALGIDPRQRKADGGLGGTPLLFDELEEEFGCLDENALVEAAERAMLPYQLIEHWAKRCEQLGLKRGSNWKQTRLPFDDE